MQVEQDGCSRGAAGEQLLKRNLLTGVVKPCGSVAQFVYLLGKSLLCKEGVLLQPVIYSLQDDHLGGLLEGTVVFKQASRQGKVSLRRRQYFP